MTISTQGDADCKVLTYLPIWQCRRVEWTVLRVKHRWRQQRTTAIEHVETIWRLKPAGNKPEMFQFLSVTTNHDMAGRKDSLTRSPDKGSLRGSGASSNRWRFQIEQAGPTRTNPDPADADGQRPDASRRTECSAPVTVIIIINITITFLTDVKFFRSQNSGKRITLRFLSAKISLTWAKLFFVEN